MLNFLQIAIYCIVLFVGFLLGLMFYYIFHSKEILFLKTTIEQKDVEIKLLKEK